MPDSRDQLGRCAAIVAASSSQADTSIPDLIYQHVDQPLFVPIWSALERVLHQDFEPRFDEIELRSHVACGRFIDGGSGSVAVACGMGLILAVGQACLRASNT